ncbi:hypothetical protein CH296_28130 [Rhodococcus sp. 14-2496-1d]|uniref:hypothetical protein n=1 Tax=Rhodococcus sp. 14-2496-1d TaxID=2023146 RepID=UPI000B9AF153|nr:hypothetical protein [Rhodococcus sp. 14-2496-1d]OZF25158.1 hypothetical protein CH296_28130 [Rhodococcus sp. 14-2496-1d]
MPHARLFIGSDSNELRAEPDIVASLLEALDATARLAGHAAIVSEFPSDDGVTTRFALYVPDEDGFSVLRAEYQGEDGAPDTEYLQRAIQCAIHLQGWIVLDAHDEVVTDLAAAKQIKARAVDHYRQQRPGI